MLAWACTVRGATVWYAIQTDIAHLPLYCIEMPQMIAQLYTTHECRLALRLRQPMLPDSPESYLR